MDGYDLVGGCKSSPVILPGKCLSGNSTGPCVVTDSSVFKESEYLSKIANTNDQKAMFKSFTSAEGSGWGVTVSGSVNLMKNSEIS